jgi:hypothetical protein
MWQFAPLWPDTGLRAAGWPQIPDRLGRAAALADGYRLGPDSRRAVPALIAPIISGCAASVVAKAQAGQAAFARLIDEGVLDELDQEARYAAAQEAPLRRRLLAGFGYAGWGRATRGESGLRGPCGLRPTGRAGRALAGGVGADEIGDHRA